MDFSNYPIVPKIYQGANGKKICINMNNHFYMLKFPSIPTRKDSELEYANSCFSEYVSCHIYDALGIPAQETLLGTFRVNNKEKIVVACKDFEVDDFRFHDFASLKNSVLTSEYSGYGTELKDVLYSIEEQHFVDSNAARQRFWDMFIVDSYIGNFDRHNGNWGFLFNTKTLETRLAPVFDCGSSLFPYASDRQMESFLNNEKEIEYRVFAIPQSALRINGIKINPYVFLQETTDTSCIRSLLELTPKIEVAQSKINQIIDSTSFISDVHKEFMKTILSQRFENILKPALRLHQSPHIHLTKSLGKGMER